MVTEFLFTASIMQLEKSLFWHFYGCFYNVITLMLKNFILFTNFFGQTKVAESKSERLSQG